MSTLVPSMRGLGKLPRYGGGWMHQFGHVYALQQELLSKDTPSNVATSNNNNNNEKNTTAWFRAVELWHTARHEGLALNVAHYSNMLRLCCKARQWEQALVIARQMRREALRPDVEGVGSMLVSCCGDDDVDAGSDSASREVNAAAAASASSQWQHAVRTLMHYQRNVKLKLDTRCFAAAMLACVQSGQYEVCKHVAAIAKDENIISPLTMINQREKRGEGEAAAAAVTLISSSGGASPYLLLAHACEMTQEEPEMALIRVQAQRNATAKQGMVLTPSQTHR